MDLMDWLQGIAITTRDWWRGWSDSDLESAKQKIGTHRMWAIGYLTPREVKAFSRSKMAAERDAIIRSLGRQSEAPGNDDT